MDRAMKRPERVNVYATQADKDAGNVLVSFSDQPYSDRGFDTYRYKGHFYPGFFDRVHNEVDACIVLTIR